MVDEVCDSWEDMLDTGVLEKKLDAIKVSSSAQSKSAAQSSSSSGIKILKRNPNSSQTSASHSNGGSNSKSRDWNIDSEPFVPSKGPQVTLEESTRTQFKPSIKILKREPRRPTAEEEAAEKARAAAMTLKTYEERVADYAKARERILGSAGTDLTSESPATSPATDSSSTPTASPYQHTAKATQYSSTADRTVQEVPLVRQPQAPDGGRGFGRR
ncbi:SUZ domain-containing protein 1 [Halotydeus destructor]|nr:SUZ domain-containing protein 1 [Halotydeus destructor]